MTFNLIKHKMNLHEHYNKDPFEKSKESNIYRKEDGTYEIDEIETYDAFDQDTDYIDANMGWD